MVDRERLARYIREPEMYLDQVAELQQVDREVFQKDWKVHDLAERELHLILIFRKFCDFPKYIRGFGGKDVLSPEG